MSDLTDYPDIRSVMNGYKTVPCEVDGCDEQIFVTNNFDPDEWYCRAHVPERLNVDRLFDDPTVRL